jgi:hypothetical protein
MIDCLISIPHLRRPEDTYVDVFVESLLNVRSDDGQDSSLGSTFGYVLVLQVLSSGQTETLVEQSPDVGVVVPR